MAIKVTLRSKPISKGRQSLYLDFYPAITDPETGKATRREFLHLYIYDKAKNPFDKQHNSDTQRIAESIRQKRDNQLNKPEIYSHYELEDLRKKELGKQNFVEYFRKLANKRQSSNHDNWVSSLRYLEEYTGGELKFADLNEAWLEDFKDFLLTAKSTRSKKSRLARNSASSYFNKIKAALKQAYKDGILEYDLNGRIEPIKPEDTIREYLTVEELNRLIKTPCNHDPLKRAALFSALTGLRFSDIEKLTWEEVHTIADGSHFIRFRQKKTGGLETLPISDQAHDLLGKRQDAKGQVFEGLKYSAYYNKYLFQWIGAAGITKDITFHCFRHTYATLQLLNGTDIYTVSKMLGHKDLKTTQIYTKVVDVAKRRAANSIKLDFNTETHE